MFFPGIAFDIFDAGKTAMNVMHAGLYGFVVRAVIPVGFFQQFAHFLKVLLAFLEMRFTNPAALLEKFSTDLVDLIGREFKAGPVLLGYIRVPQRLPLLL